MWYDSGMERMVLVREMLEVEQIRLGKELDIGGNVKRKMQNNFLLWVVKRMPWGKTEE